MFGYSEVKLTQTNHAAIETIQIASFVEKSPLFECSKHLAL